MDETKEPVCENSNSTEASSPPTAARKRKTKRSSRSAKFSFPPPSLASLPLTLPSLFGSKQLGQLEGTTLIDSGSQADILSPELVHRLGLDVRRLVAPIHAGLAADGQQVRLSLVATTSVRVGRVKHPERTFFVLPLPAGVEAILGVPWLKDSGVAVSSSSLFVAPSGPSEEIYNFDKGNFVDQPDANFESMGYTRRDMTDLDLDSFLICAIQAGVPQTLIQEVVERIDFEPHNPLLDVPDDEDPATDFTAEEAAKELDTLLGEFDDVFVDSLPGPPPLRPINHKILLKDEEVKIRPHAIRMPDRYKAQWTAHLRKFVDTGFWSPAALDSACAMFAVPKHDRTQACFVVNLKPRNENTVKMASPIPDMKEVRYRVVSKKYRSKLDFKQAYEQIRLELELVARSGFVTPNGSFVSHVMQQGDTNAPETMHQVCYLMFSKAVGRFLDVFYDDVLVYSDTRRAHLRHLRIILTSLRHYKFYLSRSKVDFFATTMEVLGAVVDDDGVHVVPEKWDAVTRWPRPKNAKDVLRFMGTVQWMSDHLLHLNEIAAVLTRLTGKAEWNWTPACDMAFDLLKSLVPRSLSPLNLEALDNGTERLFLFTDASVFGCGGWLGQGVSRDKARPFRYFSAKFNSAQRNYSTTDQELLAVFVGTKKMHEHLVGFHFTVVCDHEPLKTWLTQPPKATRRHVRLWEVLSQYDFDWEFIPGVRNVLADALSRLAELDEEERLGLPVAPEPSPSAEDPEPFPSEPSERAHVVISSLLATLQSLEPSPSLVTVAPLSVPSITSSLPPTFLDALRSATSLDALTSKILPSPTVHAGFAVEDGLVFRELESSWKLVIPSGRHRRNDGRESGLVESVVTRCHELVGHLGASKTLHYARRFFWWKTMAVDVVDFCRSCEPCARNKAPTTAPYGFLHSLDPPPRCWSRVGMDFVVGLPTSLYHSRPVDSILTVTDYLIKMVVLIPLLSTSTAIDVADLFHSYVFRRFGLPSSIVSDRDPKFTSDFWVSLNRKIGVSLAMSTAAHPQTDGRAEVTNKTVGQILRVLCEDALDDWASKLVACEFAINSATAAATELSPFEVVYGFLPSVWPAGSWDVGGNLAAEGVAKRSRLHSLAATDAIIASRVHMTHRENRHRRDDTTVFSVGDKAYLSSAGLRFPKHLAAKFIPRFIGPYTITASFPSSSNYSLALPPHLRIHNKFHASKLRPHLPNDDDRFPHRSLDSPPPVIAASDAAEAEYLIEKLVADRMIRGKREFKVRYLGYSAAEDQWRPEAELRVSAKETLDAYLALQRLWPGKKKRVGVSGLLVSLRASFSGGVSATSRSTSTT